ncbi:NAD/NADP octopine/nopaline dehydrogenase family protein [Candidatus Bathyarchaeota archaeon]|nr:NAD/NADP octopine/nopaline dehydrogenase family protein [Candidatus Bathyarchaeota archaeon]
MKIAVLGAGHGGHAMSADLSLAGHEVNLFEFEKFAENIRPIRQKGGIEIIGTSDVRTGFAKLHKVTTDIREAVEGTQLVMVVLPAYGRDLAFEALGPQLVDGQIVVAWPGYWSSLFLSNYLKSRRKPKPIISETMSLMYACRRVGPARVWVRAVKGIMPVAALPGSKTPEVLHVLKEAYPQVVPVGDVIETSLGNPNPVEHVPGMILTGGWIEATKGDFSFFEKAQHDPVPCIRKVKTAVEAERAKLGKLLGVKTDWLAEFYVKSKSATFPEHVEMRGLMFVAQSHPGRAPETLQFRYLTEDVPYGLVPMLSLGEQLGVKMPATRALVTLASIINEVDYFSRGLTVQKLGLAGLGASEIKELVKG